MGKPRCPYCSMEIEVEEHKEYYGKPKHFIKDLKVYHVRNDEHFRGGVILTCPHCDKIIGYHPNHI